MFPKDEFANDLECLMTLRNFLWKEIQEDLPDDVTFQHHVSNGCLDDGRAMRRVFPRGAHELRASVSRESLYFVGFFGESQSYPDVMRQQIWGVDDTLIKDLAKHEMIISYASMEVTKGGNWCNLVVVTSPEAVERWQGSENHSQAVAMSPMFFKSIRIHFGEMRGGISNTEFIPLRTTFLEFQRCRTVQSWT